MISYESEGYDLVCAEHPNNIKRGGVCIYYKEYSPYFALPKSSIFLRGG